MKHHIRITSIRRDPLDTTLLAQVLIELVLHRREQERLRTEKAEQAGKTQTGNKNETA